MAYKITFDPNGGIDPPEPIEHDSGLLTIPTKVPTRGPQFTFQYWQYFSFHWTPGQTVNISLSQDISLTAVWLYNGTALELSFDPDGGIGQPDDISFSLNQEITIPDSIPSKDGFEFQYWLDENTSEHYSPGDTHVFTMNTVLIAQYGEGPIPPPPHPPHGGGSGMLVFGASGALLFNPSDGNLAYDN